MNDLDLVFTSKPDTVKRKKESDGRPILLVDTAQIFFNAKYTVIKEVIGKKRFDFVPSALREAEEQKEETFFEAIDLFKHYVLNEIISKVSLFSPDHVVLAGESGSWRKRAYWDEKTNSTLYKAGRQKDREEDEFDWTRFFQEITSFQEDLRQFFPFVFVKCYDAEGDDVIASLAFHLSETTEKDVIVMSRDKDFKQLLMLPRLRLYNNYEKTFVDCAQPKEDLLAQILLGDQCDGIPNVRRPRDCFVTGQKCEQGQRLGEKAVWKAITENKVSETILTTEEVKKRFEENKKLIDLREIPREVQDAVVRVYEKELDALHHKGSRKLLEYFAERKMHNIMGRFHHFENLFKK